MDEISPKPFWCRYTPLSRFGWTTLVLLPMWVAATALLAICLCFVAFIGLAYPIVHYIWGMQSSVSASSESGKP